MAKEEGQGAHGYDWQQMGRRTANYHGFAHSRHANLDAQGTGVAFKVAEEADAIARAGRGATSAIAAAIQKGVCVGRGRAGGQLVVVRKRRPGAGNAPVGQRRGRGLRGNRGRVVICSHKIRGKSRERG